MQTLKPRLQVLNTRVAKTHTQTERIRGGNLQRIREDYFRLKPLCVACEEAGRTSLATELDHIVPLWKGGADAPHNRQGLCSPCHAAKTAEEARERQGSSPW